MLTIFQVNIQCATSFSGNSSVGRARPCQGRCREFESRFPLQYTVFLPTRIQTLNGHLPEII